MKTAKDRVVEALLCSRSLREASELSGVSDRTIREWLRSDDDFKRTYQQVKGDNLQAISDRLAENVSTALDVLTGIVEDDTQKSSVRVRASQIVIDSYVKILQFADFEERLTALEKRVNDDRRKD